MTAYTYIMKRGSQTNKKKTHKPSRYLYCITLVVPKEEEKTHTHLQNVPLLFLHKFNASFLYSEVQIVRSMGRGFAYQSSACQVL